MSTGGAAMKASIKQVVAANKQGIISTPNQPTYRRFSVLVTHWQNLSQLLVLVPLVTEIAAIRILRV
jgi:hypothetical protein